MRRLGLMLVLLAGLALPGQAAASQLIARDARDVTLRVNAERRGAPLLHGTREALGRARVGRDQRDPPDGRTAAGRLPARLFGRLADVPQDAVRRVSERLRPLPGTAARLVRDRVHHARREPLGGAVLAAGTAEPGTRPLDAAAGRTRAPAEPLEHGASQARAVDELGIQQALPPRLRAPHVPRAARLRLPGLDEGSPVGQLRPQHLPRHPELRLRARVEARELVPRAHRHRGLLLRLLPARPLSGIPRGGSSARGERRAVSRHGDRPGRDAGRRMGRRRACHVRRVARP